MSVALKTTLRRLGLCLFCSLSVGCTLLDRSGAEDPLAPVCPTLEPVTCPEPLPPVVIETAAACPEREESSCPTVVPNEVTGHNQLLIVGAVEYVDLLSVDMRKKARIDTGAETTSIDATDIVEFERDGKRWVQFRVVDRENGEASEIKAPIERTVRIKQHGVDNVRRQVVKLELRLGSLTETVEVTLADRERFDYPILLGRNFLEGRVVVDVSRQYLALEN